MNGQALINSLMYSVGKIQTLTADTNYRTMALDWLNQVAKDISSRQAHWRWLEKTSEFDTVVDQMSYDLPSDIDTTRIFSLRQKTSDVKLGYIDQSEFDRIEPDPTSTGNPYLYTMWAGSLRLYPIPSAIITMYLRYIKKIDSFTDSATEHADLPDKYYEIVLDGLKVKAFSYEPEWGNPVTQKQIYEAGIDRIINDNAYMVDDDGVSDRHYMNDKMRGPYSFDPQGDFSAV